MFFKMVIDILSSDEDEFTASGMSRRLPEAGSHDIFKTWH